MLIDTDLFRPIGISVDYVTQRLYWVDMRQGIYYRIDRSDLNGRNRQIVFEGTHQKPVGVAVDVQFIYWTDVNNNALWVLKKDQIERPTKIREFKEKPMGVVTKHLGFSGTVDCANIMEAITNYNESSTETFEEVVDVEESVPSLCLNRGKEVESGCECPRGFTGQQCEISLCYNYCVEGACVPSGLGYPQCHCRFGFRGTRCEINSCEQFCLNGGTCKHVKGSPWGANCTCPGNFTGTRCEIGKNMSDGCSEYCKNEQRGDEEKDEKCR